MDRDANYLYHNLKLCSEHFEDSMFLNSVKNRLHRHAVPTLFEHSYQHITCESAFKRKFKYQEAELKLLSRNKVHKFEDIESRGVDLGEDIIIGGSNDQADRVSEVEILQNATKKRKQEDPKGNVGVLSQQNICTFKEFCATTSSSVQLEGASDMILSRNRKEGLHKEDRNNLLTTEGRKVSVEPYALHQKCSLLVPLGARHVYS
ncbi:hypothetical protein SK128_028255 [Halocaridina rubra]|uniref:THAP-type domain-containing protein n=1 Tax=Halocaridina rubra TaxID=373956 RepID=A0AAN8WPX9_HALRR